MVSAPGPECSERNCEGTYYLIGKRASGTQEMEKEARKAGVGAVDPHIHYPAGGPEGTNPSDS